MEDAEIISLWKSYDIQLERNLTLNRKNAEDITKLKIQSSLVSMRSLKIFTILVGMFWVGFIDILIVNLFHFANPFFLISAGIQVLLTKLAIGIYVYQLVVIQQINIFEPVLATQQKIARLKSSTLLVARLLFLQLPVWTTFYWNESMVRNGNIFLDVLQLIVTASFTFIAVWLFVNIKFENRDKKWFKFIFNGSEWNPVIKALALTRELDSFKAEE